MTDLPFVPFRPAFRLSPEMIDPQRYPRLSRIQVPADLRQFPEE